MRDLLRLTIVICLGLTSAGGTVAYGALSLDLDSDPDDISAVSLGDTFRVDVILGGLTQGDELEYLAATVEYDDLLLSLPTITPGAIIPDVAGFTATELDGVADGFYDNLDAPPAEPMITSNGVFYSFDVTAIAAGNGVHELTFVDVYGYDADGNEVDIGAGRALSFTTVAETVIAEPTSFVVWLLALGCVGVAARRRRRRRT